MMVKFFDIVSADSFLAFTDNEKKDFIIEILITGKFYNYKKFIIDNGFSIVDFLNNVEVLRFLPFCIDVELIKIVLTSYEFPNGLQFFFNYGLTIPNKDVKAVIYEYFENNFSHIMFDNMQLYEKLLILDKKLICY